MGFSQWILDIAKKIGLDLSQPASPAWVPTYEPQQYVTTTMGDGTTKVVPIAIDYLATADTAAHLQKLYGGTVVSVPFEGDGGPNSASAQMRELELPAAVTGQPPVRIIAGLLAVFYTQNPNNPDEADRLCRAAITAHGAVAATS
jgi:hypothetical protein